MSPDQSPTWADLVQAAFTHAPAREATPAPLFTGTTNPAKVARRRAKSKVARRSRQINRSRS